MKIGIVEKVIGVRIIWQMRKKESKKIIIKKGNCIHLRYYLRNSVYSI